MGNISFLSKNKIKTSRFAIFFLAQGVSAFYPVAGRFKFRNGLLLTIFIFFAGLTFASPAYGANNVFYSVGQNTTTHETGAGNVTVSGTTATFTVAQTATNMGVGDVIDYDTDNKKCYISGKTSTTVWTCTNATGGAPTSATGVVVNSVSHAFNSLSASEAGAPTLLGNSDLTAIDVQLNFPCYYDTGADTTAVIVDGYTTDATRYIKIYTPNNTTTEVNRSQRHSGKWDDGKYRLVVGTADGAVGVQIKEDYVRIEGLQSERINATSSPWSNVIYVSNTAIDTLSDIYISDSILRKGNSTYGVITITSGKTTIRNSIISEGAAIGIVATYDANASYVSVENCTVINNGTYGVQRLGTIAGLIVKNTYSGDNPSGDYDGVTSMTTSASSDTTGSAGLQSIALNTSNFTSLVSGQEDYHLTNNSALRNVGTDLSGTFSTDIDNQSRPAWDNAVWDIGADEYTPTKNVYYSVGQSVADLKTGAPSVTIAGGAATFTVAQTGNIGVGDRVTYNTSQIAYISAKTNADGAHWSLVTATGALPANISNSAVVSITREFTSLSSAEAAANNIFHLNTSDIVGANVILNLPCYYDSGADTTAVTIDGYTTGANNFIRIFTPNNTNTEANISQRHQGKWSDTKYNLSPATGIPLTVSDENVRIDGLQSYSLDDDSIYINGATLASDTRISHAIIKGNAIASKRGINLSTTGASSHAYIYNTIIYDYSGATANGIFQNDADWTTYLYSNTYHGNTQGINNNAGVIIAKNNIVKGSGNINSYIGTFAAGTDYNATDGTDNIGTGAYNRISQTFSFLGATNKDFHLALSDTAAKNAGVNLSLDSYNPFSTDIDGQQRTGQWSIGADDGPGVVIDSPNVPPASKITFQTSQTDKLTNGLVGMWSFDGPDVSGTTAYDRSGNNNHGTISGAVPVIGKKGQGMNFDASLNQYISTTKTFDPIFTYSAWVNVSNVSAVRVIVGPSNDSSPSLSVNTNRTLILQKAGISSVGSSTGAVSLNAWNHVVVTYNSSTGDYAFYINSTPAGSGNNALSFTLTRLLQIGTRYSGNFGMQGKIDEVRIYNRVLSVDEINYLYNSGKVSIE